MKFILFFSSIWLSVAGSAQSWAKQYDFVDECSCGLALVSKDGKRGFVTKEGKLVIPVIYDDALHFTEGMAAVKKDGKWGYLDSTGKAVSYTHLRAHETGRNLVCRLLLEKKKKK